MVGTKVGRLLVVGIAPSDGRRHRRYRCICDCGNETIKRPHQLQFDMNPCCRDCASNIKPLDESSRVLAGAYFGWMKLRIRGLQFRHPDLADDIESTAMYALVVAAGTYEEQRSRHYEAGFERFAEFALRSYLRLHVWRKMRMKREALGRVQCLRPEITAAPGDALARIEARLDCDYHLNKLSRHHRDILWLTHACDCSPSEVGEIVHRTRANVNIQYRRAMAQLREP